MAAARRNEMGFALVGASGLNEVDNIRQYLRMGADVDHLLKFNEGGHEMCITALAMASTLGHVPAD